MQLLIYASKLDSGTLVNKVGKYLKNSIDGAFKISFHPMSCEVLMRMYYQVPENPDTFNEMQFSIDITSYQNKLRINLTERTAMEKTIGQIILQSDELQDFNIVKNKVMTKIDKFIAKEYADYDFIF